MKYESNTRQLREAAHQHKYAIVTGDSCTYCGAPVKPVDQGSAGDHVPPLAVLDANFGIPVGDMKVVPCCSECNTKLGASTLVTVELRRSHIINSRPYLGKTEGQIIAQALYNATVNEGFKRGDGQVDTPDAMAEQILDRLQLLGSLCDPACGDGSFVRMQIKRLIDAGVSHAWIEENIRGYDIDVEMVAEAIRRLRRDFPGLNGKVIFKQKDVFEMNEHFTTIIMNPPWTLKQDGKVVKQNVWRQFADAALKLAETVVIVAPMAARQAGKRVLFDAVRFEGVEHDGCVVLWSEAKERDFSAFPKFDLVFSAFGGGLGRSIRTRKTDMTMEISNWAGEPFYVNPTTAARCGVDQDKGMFRLRSRGNHDAKYGRGLLADCTLAYGTAVEFFRFIEFAKSGDGHQLIQSLLNQKNGGFIAVPYKLLNAAFSSRHQK